MIRITQCPKNEETYTMAIDQLSIMIFMEYFRDSKLIRNDQYMKSLVLDLYAGFADIGKYPPDSYTEYIK
ncbi:MAG: hypothetical protein ACXACU_15880, partial [Candidatus Hodarchaeales archaeon]